MRFRPSSWVTWGGVVLSCSGVPAGDGQGFCAMGGSVMEGGLWTEGAGGGLDPGLLQGNPLKPKGTGCRTQKGGEMHSLLVMSRPGGIDSGCCRSAVRVS